MTIDKGKENQQVVLAAIKEWFQHSKYGPSYRDLSGLSDLALGTVYGVCKELHEDGYIDLDVGVARSIRLRK